MGFVYTKNKRWKIEVDNRSGYDFAVCSNCGIILENFNLGAIETGCFYCSESCAKEHIKENEPEGGY